MVITMLESGHCPCLEEIQIISPSLPEESLTKLNSLLRKNRISNDIVDNQ